jgi:hypothetical protein
LLYVLIAYRPATGRVTGLRHEWSSDGDGPYFYTEFKFVTDTGETVAGVSRVGARMTRRKPGDSIRVLYHPHNPTRSVVRSFGNLWYFPLVISLLALAFAWGVIKGILESPPS